MTTKVSEKGLSLHVELAGESNRLTMIFMVIF